jgi:nucleotide-binding universal stress UspA family protein
MYKVIMVPTDGSGFDREAIRVALRIADRCGAKTQLVRVLGTGAFFGTGMAADGVAVAADVTLTDRERVLSELYALATECRALSEVDIRVDLHSGPVGDVLEGYARRHNVDLIVISTHGRSGIARFSLGSVTDALIRHTAIPILVVKPPTSYLNPQVNKAFKRIVVPLDGSKLAEQILPRVSALATIEEAEVILLNVLIPHSYSQKEIVDPNLPWWDKDIAIARQYLFGIAAKFRHNGLAVTTDIIIGESIASAIGDYAGRERADLIAIATHGRGGLTRMVRGSVATAVMHSAKVSMLVLKPDNVAEMKVSVVEGGVAADLIPA